ncbi:MAG: ligand-binding protein SH3 [Rhodospirillaceae bacterium]|nr:ligand-binding protein SH3 [Rhodospirillaceae bacterium]|tara:strand:+ start:259 stop:579 length:321 start_codon:yes stop_codon:yes gene_type:complete
MNPWVLLSVAIALEVVGVSFLKMSEGFERPIWGALSIIAYIACFLCLSPILKSLPVGVIYAIWSGAGIAVITLIGMFVFKQPLDFIQLFFISLIAVGAIGLQLTSK